MYPFSRPRPPPHQSLLPFSIGSYITTRATSGRRRNDRNTSGQRGNNVNTSYRDISIEKWWKWCCKAEMSTGNFAKWNVKQFFKSVDCTNIFYCCNKQWRHWKGYRWHPEGHQEESYLRFVTYSVTSVAKKENQNRGPQIILPPCPQKMFKFFATSPVPVGRSGQALMVIGPRIAANYGL